MQTSPRATQFRVLELARANSSVRNVRIAIHVRVRVARVLVPFFVVFLGGGFLRGRLRGGLGPGLEDDAVQTTPAAPWGG